MDYIAFNEQRKPFQDVHVRRAIAYAIDRKAMVKTVLFGNGTAGGLAALAAVRRSTTRTPGAPSFDLAKAKQEMAQSSVPKGFSHHDPDQRPATRTRPRSRRSCSPSSRRSAST